MTLIVETADLAQGSVSSLMRIGNITVYLDDSQNELSKDEKEMSVI